MWLIKIGNGSSLITKSKTVWRITAVPVLHGDSSTKSLQRWICTWRLTLHKNQPTLECWLQKVRLWPFVALLISTWLTSISIRTKDTKLLWACLWLWNQPIRICLVLPYKRFTNRLLRTWPLQLRTVRTRVFVQMLTVPWLQLIWLRLMHKWKIGLMWKNMQRLLPKVDLIRCPNLLVGGILVRLISCGDMTSTHKTLHCGHLTGAISTTSWLVDMQQVVRQNWFITICTTRFRRPTHVENFGLIKRNILM